MPMDLKKYPPNWKAISLRIRYEVAHGQCQCEGECGLHKTNPGPRRCVERDGEQAVWARGKVVLTVAHLDFAGGVCDCYERTGKKCGIESHLKAMCQRCHIRVDMPHHRRNAAATRRAKKNNLELFGE